MNDSKRSRSASELSPTYAVVIKRLQTSRLALQDNDLKCVVLLWIKCHSVMMGRRDGHDLSCLFHQA
jgi:hypothetical protein